MPNNLRQSVLLTKYPSETEPIDIQAWFKDIQYLIDDNENFTVSGSDDLYKAVLNIDSDKVETLKSCTSPNLLTCEGEITPFKHNMFDTINKFRGKLEENKPPLLEESPLRCIQKRAKMAAMGKLVPTFMKYSRYRWCPVEKRGNRMHSNMKCYGDVIYTIKVYGAFLSDLTIRKDVTLLQEIQMLGDQTLSELRDTIQCQMDYTGLSDVSGFPSPATQTTLAPVNKYKYPGGFFFIENTFYNDIRSPGVTDLSQIIMDWAKNKFSGPFTTAAMEGTVLGKIQLRLGRPYLYQHQGNCEHVIMISDVRLTCPSDVLRRSFYPQVTGTGNVNGRKCFMCSVNYARWLVVGNARLLRDQSYLCHKCFISFNYVDGQKIGNFQAYEYVDPIAIL